MRSGHRAGINIGIGTVTVLFALSGCGGSSEEPSSVVVYDEAINGPLPFTLDGLSQNDLAKYTASLAVGTNIVKGTSTGGEAILLKVPAGRYLKSVDVSFTSHNDGNALVVDVERFPYDGTSFIDSHSMPSIGSYTYTVSAPNTSFGNGNYDLRISSAVSGASIPNEFVLSVHIE